MNSILTKNIIEEFNLDALPESEQAEFLDHAGLTLYQAIILRCFNMLDVKGKKGLDEALDEDEGDNETVLSYLYKKIPHLEGIVEEEIVMLKKEMVDSLSSLR